MADVRDLRPDADTTLGMLLVTVKRLTDTVNKLASEVAQVKASVETFPQLVADAAAENRRYYRSLQSRLDEELGSDYDDISGSHDVKSLRDAGRSWRKRAREQEEEAIKAAAKAEVEAAEKARLKRLMAGGWAIGAVVVGVWEALRMAGVVK